MTKLPAGEAEPTENAIAKLARRWWGLGSNWGGLICAVLTALCLWATQPSLEMGVLDDFSYTKTAFELARTGHVVYNGWAAAMLGWQVYWGALFVELFGYSYLAVRLSTVPIAMGCAYLLFWLGIRFGLSVSNAVLATCTFVLSPLFIPLAASFMSDVAGVFCILLGLVCCLKALEARSSRWMLIWLALASLDGLLGGTVRQIAWLTGLLMVPCTAWLLRKARGVIAGAIGFWLLTIVGVLGCLSWYRHQQYSVPERILYAPLNIPTAVLTLQQYRDMALTILLLALPCLAAFLATLRSRQKNVFFTLLFVAILLVGVRLHSRGAGEMAPWLNHIVTPYGVGGAGYWEGTGERPAVWAGWARIALSFLLTVPTCAFLAKLLERARPGATGRLAESKLSWRTVFVLLVPFSLGYFALLGPRAMVGATLDRYLLPMFALGLLPLLRFYQENAGGYVSKTAFVLMAIYAGYGVAVTHDYFVVQRARLDAAEEVREEKHVARTQIQGGFEYDGETQIDEVGYLNDDRIDPRLHAYHDVQPLSGLPVDCRFYFAVKTPVVQPRYFVVYQPSPCLTDSDLAAVGYSLWLPPFRGAIRIQQLPHS